MFRNALFLAFAAPLAALAAQAPGTITFQRPAERLEANAGDAWKTAIVIGNRGRAPMRLTPEVRLPAGWQPLLPAEAFECPPGTTNLLLLNAVVPRGELAGTYPIYVRLRSHLGVIATEDTVRVTVLPRRAVSVVGEAGPRYAAMDTSFTVDFVVRNLGNVPLTVDLEPHAPDADVAVRDSSRLTLSIGDKRYVAVVVGPSQARGAGVQRVELRARSVDRKDDYRGGFDVLRVSEMNFQGAVLPVNVRLRAYSRDGSVTPALISGGYVGRRDTFDLLVRRPGSSATIFGERDEYRARWSGARGHLVAGDVVLSDGLVRDSYEMLTGVDAALKLGRITARGYDASDRLFDTGAGEYGGSLALRAASWLELGAGALQRVGPDTGAAGGRAWRAFTSVGSADRSRRTPLLSAEVAGGRDGVSAYAVRMQRRFGGGRGWMDASAADVTSAHPVRERGSSRLAVGAGLRISRYLSIQGRAGQFELDTLATRPFAFRTDTRSGGFTLGPLTAEYRQEEREAFVDGSAYATQERGTRVNLGHAFGRLSLGAGAELGQTLARDSAAAMPYRRVSGSASVSGSSRLWGGVSLEYFSREGLAKNQQLSGTVTTTARLFSGTRVELMGSVFHVLFPTVESYSMLNARVEQALGKGHTIALRARTFTTTSRAIVPERTTVFFEYSVPLDIPLPGVGPRPVRARVVEAGTGTGVPGALVRMGDYAAITNRDGRVTFAPAAKLEALQVERANATMPLVLEPDSVRRRGELRVVITDGARIAGSVRRYDRVTRDSIAATGGIPEVAITLVQGGDTVRVETLTDGSFDVPQLPPGTWTVTASGGRLPPAYGFQRSSTVVSVPPGRTAAVEFRVMLRSGEAALSEGGALELQAKPPKRP